MDLIFTNSKREDVGVLLGFTLDIAFGNEENDFELKTTLGKTEIEDDAFIYIEGTEYGGIIDGVSVDTKEMLVRYLGRSFHGILNSKVICPPAGAAYYTASGDANVVIKNIIDAVGLSDLFQAASVDSGIMISNYDIDRYIRAYDGITKMLKSVDAKLKIRFMDGKINLEAVPIVDYSQDEQYSSDHYGFKIVKYKNKVNHLICLGKGELTDRQVLHLYVQEDGSISTSNQFFTGLDEYAEIYDFSSVESIEELEKQGMERLQELNNNDSAELDLTDDETVLDINDIVGATEEVTRTSITNRVIKKIVQIENDTVKIDYKVGD